MVLKVLRDKILKTLELKSSPIGLQFRSWNSGESWAKVLTFARIFGLSNWRGRELCPCQVVKELDYLIDNLIYYYNIVSEE